MSGAKYKRILLKLSGEVLAGKQKTGVNADVIGDICDKIKEVVNMGVEVAIVVGGGNFGEAEMDIKWREQQPIIWECLQLQ